MSEWKFGRQLIMPAVLGMVLFLNHLTADAKGSERTKRTDPVSILIGNLEENFFPFQQPTDIPEISASFTYSGQLNKASSRLFFSIPHEVAGPVFPEQNTDQQTCNPMDTESCSGGFRQFYSFSELEGFPVKTIQLIWSPRGNLPLLPSVNQVAVYFHQQSISEIKAIAAGTCTPMFIDCDLKQSALTPVASQFLPTGFSQPDEQSLAPWAGASMFEATKLPANAGAFTQVYSYGAFAGNLAFQGPIISVDFMKQLPANSRQCFDIPHPQEWQDNSFYPQQWCLMRYTSSAGDSYSLSLQDFTAGNLGTNAADRLTMGITTLIAFTLLSMTM
ncbi:hypothetical protein EOPP23_19730 [Endozoicomonas sp. OPT23]|uniref:hypothetical protein n=1 Tax=Endozoicomonas sp. OPT23 TaxID=2072845 RepID=UPI00129ACADE|nr:hypothetical protein [Endozoicomonas sp. OPT23]MRI35202.1 hypothetical protein [Endozoicomonas sp. OPT23]